MPIHPVPGLVTTARRGAIEIEIRPPLTPSVRIYASRARARLGGARREIAIRPTRAPHGSVRLEDSHPPA